MVLKLALIIEGDAKGAKTALVDTSKGIEELSTKADQAAGKTDAIGKLAEVANEAGPALGEVSTNAGNAAKGIVKMGDAAGGAQGKVNGFATTVGGLLAGVGVATLTTGFAILATEAVKWITAIVDQEAKIKQVLGDHGKLVDKISGKYSNAARGVFDYGAESVAGLRFEAQQNIPALQDAFQSETNFTLFKNANRQQAFGQKLDDLGPFEESMRRLIEEVQTGTPDVISFRKEISEIGAALDKGNPLRAWAAEASSALQPAAELQAEIKRSKDVLAGLEGDSNAAARGLSGLPKAFEDAGSAANRMAEAVGKLKAEIRALGSGIIGAGTPAPATGTPPATPFAAGGIVDRPTLFGMGGGGLGLMGEAGPEAIMPLSRGGGGLSVGADAGGGREVSVPITRLASGRLGVTLSGGVTPFADGGVVGGGSTVFQPLRDELTQLRQLSQSVFTGMAQDMLRGASAGEVLKNTLNQVLSAAIQFSTTSLASAIFSGGAGGLGSVFPRAEGGPVSAGGNYLVGEYGPEVLRMGAAGTVIPNSGGGRSIAIGTINIDARGAQAGVAEQIAAIMPSVISESVRQATGGVQGEIQRLVETRPTTFSGIRG